VREVDDVALRIGGRGWRALRHSNYRLYFFGQVVSQSGTRLQRIAQSWLVLDVSNSPAALGVLTVFQFTPALALSLVAGVVADRVGKQRLIMITSTLEALQALAMAALTFSVHVQLWVIYLLAFLLGLFTTFETPASRPEPAQPALHGHDADRRRHYRRAGGSIRNQRHTGARGWPVFPRHAHGLRLPALATRQWHISIGLR
jgi:hypothetical protein